MKTIEAVIALAVFLLILQLFHPVPRPIDGSLYQTQLAGDAWRVFQLRGDLQGFDKNKLNADADKITELTSLCVEFEEEDVTSCIPADNIIQVNRVAVIGGEPETITLRIGNPA